MLKIILGVIVGFVIWSIIWVGSDQVLIQSVGWYGAQQHLFERAMFNKEPFSPDITILLLNLVRSVVISFLSGYLAALVANENAKTPLILGVLLLLAGLAVEIIAWNYLPIWYHFIFLILLTPVTIAGGKLKQVNRSVQTA